MADRSGGLFQTAEKARCHVLGSSSSLDSFADPALWPPAAGDADNERGTLTDDSTSTEWYKRTLKKKKNLN